jgi:hypothetical protein
VLYTTLTNNELERWVRNTPKDHKARAELLRRSILVLKGSDAYIEELETQIAVLEDKVDQLNEDLNSYE